MDRHRSPGSSGPPPVGRAAVPRVRRGKHRTTAPAPLESASCRRSGSATPPGSSASATTPSGAGSRPARCRSRPTRADRKVVDGAGARALRPRAGQRPAADPSGVERSARNRFVGLVTEVTADTVMAQVELQCGPVPRRVADEQRGRRASSASSPAPSPSPSSRPPPSSSRPRRTASPRRPRDPYAPHPPSPPRPPPPCCSPAAGGSTDRPAASGSAAAATSAASGQTLTVFAAASLKATFTDARHDVRGGPPGHRR